MEVFLSTCKFCEVIIKLLIKVKRSLVAKDSLVSAVLKDLCGVLSTAWLLQQYITLFGAWNFA